MRYDDVLAQEDVLPPSTGSGDPDGDGVPDVNGNAAPAAAISATAPESISLVDPGIPQAALPECADGVDNDDGDTDSPDDVECTNAADNDESD